MRLFKYFIILFTITSTITQAQTWTQLTWSGTTPGGRSGHSAIYDSINNRMTIFGGNYTFNDTWVLTHANGLGGTPSWAQISPSGTLPGGRWGHTAVYDTTNNRMTIFAGEYEYAINGSFLNDVWVLNHANGLGGTPTWIQLSPTGSIPTTRYEPTAVYDVVNNRMTIFGGYFRDNHGNTNFLNDVWVLSNANGLGGTPSWTELFPIGSPPSVRLGSTAVYDAVNNRMTIFGGNNTLNDVWVLSHANGLGGTPAWTQLLPTGIMPAGRYQLSSIYDETNNLMTIFGGNDLLTNYDDIWVLSHANGLGGTPAWAQISPIGGYPSERFGHTAVYDATRNRKTIFGGSNSEINFNDTWVLSTANGIAKPNAGFYVTPTTSGVSPLSVIFIDTSTNVQTNWNWFFGDGSTSNLQNPVHVYSTASVSTSFSVTLIASNSVGASTANYENYISVSPPPPPVAGFYAYPTVGEGPLTVNFVDVSANNPTNWSWDFGDGGNSNLQNPIYTYASVTIPISYSVQLIASNYLGVSTTTYMNFVTVNPASPPVFSSLPSLKLFSNQSITNAFSLNDYITSDVATGYSILNNFVNLAVLNGSTVSQGAYGSATSGTNTFIASNTVGESTANDKVKYSTYKIHKLPHVGLTVGSFWTINLANYTYDSSGLALPPSFGNNDSLTTDNPAISATWLDNSTVYITSTSAFSGVANVFVTASPNASAAYGSDLDVECVQVYNNLLTNSTFSTANDINTWLPVAVAPGRTILATQSWVSSYTDSAGTSATGVWKITFSNASSGIKSTPKVSSWITLTTGQWYIVRMRLVADSTNNNHQSLLFGYTNIPGPGIQLDIVGNVLFGIPTVWTWQEVPLLVHGNTSTGYPQFQFKAGDKGNIYIDEIQILNATPSLLEARSNTQAHYRYGQFTSGNDTTGWGQEIYAGAGTSPGISVNNGLILNFAGATSGIGQEGIKWTANNGVVGSSNAYSFPVNQNYDVNVGLNVTILSGTFNSLGVVLVSAYGIQTAGQQNIGIPPSNLMAAASVGVLNSGKYYAEGVAINPYYQAQFGIRSDLPGIVMINDVDVGIDNDDPNFGDANLFP